MIDEAVPTGEERALFNGRQVLRTLPEFSGGPDSSGVEGDVLSVVSSAASPTATIAAERERLRAVAELNAANAALAAERAALAAERAASVASISALEEQLRLFRFK